MEALTDPGLIRCNLLFFSVPFNTNSCERLKPAGKGGFSIKVFCSVPADSRGSRHCDTGRGYITRSSSCLLPTRCSVGRGCLGKTCAPFATEPRFLWPMETVVLETWKETVSMCHLNVVSMK